MNTEISFSVNINNQCHVQHLPQRICAKPEEFQIPLALLTLSGIADLASHGDITKQNISYTAL
jgi:hypothetical protein